MTTHMVRKQIYIHKRQNTLLKRLSQARGVSEAEIIRQAIDREISGEAPKSTVADRSAWQLSRAGPCLYVREAASLAAAHLDCQARRLV